MPAYSQAAQADSALHLFHLLCRPGNGTIIHAGKDLETFLPDMRPGGNFWDAIARLDPKAAGARPPSGQVKGSHDENQQIHIRWEGCVIDGAALTAASCLIWDNSILCADSFQYEQLYQEQNALIDSIHDGIWITDGDGITLRVSKAMERIADIRESEVIGLHINEAKQLKGFATSVSEEARRKRETITVFDDYANGRRCLNTCTPVFDDTGNITRCIAVIRDITELEELNARLTLLEQSNQHYKMRLEELISEEKRHIIGSSPATRRFRIDLQKAARTNATILLLGETGTGKSFAAKSIHEQSERADKPFVALNCGSIPASLAESEFFGYEHGAFTGAAQKGKKGVFELAEDGTLFLDEITELPLELQVKLLHVFDDFAYRKVGGTKSLPLRARIIAATNKNLDQAVAAETFRKDLLYRLRVVALEIPPLRERIADVPELITHFISILDSHPDERICKSTLIAALMKYPWPGNIRQLREIVHYMVSMTEGTIFGLENLPSYFSHELLLAGAMPTNGISLEEAVEKTEKAIIAAALLQTKSSYKAAALLKTSQSTVVRKAKRYGILLEPGTRKMAPGKG